MSPTPDRLRAAADSLRTMATALAADADDLVPLGGLSTWRGPAADVHRAGALVTSHRIDEVAGALRTLVATLSREADLVDARMAEVVEAHERRWRRGVDR